MSTFFLFFYTFFSIILFTLAIPNEFLFFGSPLLGCIALIPFYIALRNTKSYKTAGFLTGFLLSLVQLFSSFWLGYFKDFAIFTLGAPVIAYFILGLAAGRVLFHTFQFKPQIRVFIFAALWTLWEVVKSTGFLAYPWGTLIITTPKWSLLTQIAGITGMWGMSFLLSLITAVSAECIMSGKIRLCRTLMPSILFTIFLLSLTLGYGIYQYTRQWKSEKTLNLIIVQQNVDSWYSSEAQILQKSQNLTRQALQNVKQNNQIHPDLISWSEGVLSYSYPDNINYYQSTPKNDPFIPFLQEINTPLLIGGPIILMSENPQTSGEFEAYNSALLLQSNGQMSEFYGKVQLVAFAEFIPFMDKPWMKKFMDTLVGFSSGWTQGKKLQLFTIPLSSGETVRFSTPICFEDAFPSICRQLYNAGSEVFINLTNDAWSKTKSAEYQHFAIASFRAIEFRTTLVRSTNAGYSVVLDPRGVILDDMPLFEATSLYTSVPVYKRIDTFYAQFGNWFPYTLFCLLIILFVYANIKQKNNSIILTLEIYP